MMNPEEELNRYRSNCRLCLKKGEEYRFLPDPNIKAAISEAINGLNLLEDSSLSQLVCKVCCNQIFDFNRAACEIRANQRTLLDLLKHNRNGLDDIEVKVEIDELEEKSEIFVEPVIVPQEKVEEASPEHTFDDEYDDADMDPDYHLSDTEMDVKEEVPVKREKDEKKKVMPKTGKPPAPQYIERKNEFICPVCKKSFTDKWNLQCHGRRNHSEYDWHFTNRTWNCRFCGIELKTNRCKMSHERGHKEFKGARQAPTGEIGKTGKPKAPQMIQLEGERVKCPICFMTFRTKTNMQGHGHRFHNEYDWYFRPLKQSRVCKYCGKEFRKLQLRKDHEESKHEGRDKYQCAHCSYDTPYKDSLRTHLRLNHTEDGIKQAFEGSLKCKNCEYVAESRKDLLAHRRVHFPLVPERPKKFQCTECSLSFASERKLQDHIKEMHGRYKCGLCMLAVFETFEGFSKHMTRHNPDARTYEMQPHPCSLCELRFCNQELLDKHVKNHERHRLTCCEVCGRTVTKDVLKKHMLSHSDTKSFMCEICGKKFLHVSGVRDHMKVHLNPDRFECERCGFSHHKKQVYSLHQKRCTGVWRGGVPIFRCKRCGEEFEKKSQRQKHIRLTHTGFRCVRCVYQAPNYTGLKRHYKSIEHKMAKTMKGATNEMIKEEDGE